MLLKLPNGDWIDPRIVVGVRTMASDRMGPRVLLDTTQGFAQHMIEFDGPEAARKWAEEFGQQCAAAQPAA